MMGGVHMWWNSVLKNSTRGGRSPHVVGGVHTWWEESTRGGRSPHVVGGVHTWWEESTRGGRSPHCNLSHNRRLFRQQLGFAKSFFAGCANLDGSLET